MQVPLAQHLLWEHIMQRAKPIIHQCPVCSQEFRTKLGADYHLRTKHSGSK